MTSIAVDSVGQKMATAGVDGDVRIWDIRNFKPIHTYFSHAPASNLEISQQGLLAVGFGSRVQVVLSCLEEAKCTVLETYLQKAQLQLGLKMASTDKIQLDVFGSLVSTSGSRQLKAKRAF